CARSARGFAYW
nr:immunoglobulin heavy chain junction region [Mus musculus]NSM08991.1 immunoglobulin heavy chain junction region [Mus musculus]NSM09086.1 immunoglobulin heavy chain junction region [Mus musculus]